MNIKAVVSIVLLSLCPAPAANAQLAEDSELFAQVMQLDRQIFELGFNQCRLDAFESLIAADLSFHHDQAGTQDRAQFLQAFHQNICGSAEHKPIRTLIPGTTQAFPLQRDGEVYGVIQQGMHRFHINDAADAEASYTIARFTHVWLLRDGKWQLAQVLSFDHQPHRSSIAAQADKPAQTRWLKLMELSLASFSLSLSHEVPDATRP